METIEVTAKTVDEAIEIALKELDARREEVEIDVVSRGRSGILGIGGELAKVRATRVASPQDDIVVAQSILDGLLSAMKVMAVVHLKSSEGEDGSGPVFEIEGDDSGLLIGRRGETLQSIQFLVNLMVRRRLKNQVFLVIDVEGYRERRHRALSSLALQTAERVARSGHPITLHPMPASERRVIHITLADHPQVTTESSGEGEGRKVTISRKMD